MFIIFIKISVDDSNRSQVSILSTVIGKRRELESLKLQVSELKLQMLTQIMKQHKIPTIVIPMLQYKPKSISPFFVTNFVFNG